MKVLPFRCLVPVRLFPRPSRYPMTSPLVSVTYPGELTFSLGPRDPKRVDRDKNGGLGTRQIFSATRKERFRIRIRFNQPPPPLNSPHHPQRNLHSYYDEHEHLVNHLSYLALNFG